MLERFVTRLFSEKLNLLPGWTNFLDYPLLILFAIYVLGRTRGRRKKQPPSGFELPWGKIMAASVIVTLPLIALVVYFQRLIVSGLSAGAVKG